MVAIAKKIIQQKEQAFDPADFEDRYEDALRALIEEKSKGHKIARPEEPERPSNVVSLMDALEASLKGGHAKKPAAAPRKARPPARRAPKRRTRRSSG